MIDKMKLASAIAEVGLSDTKYLASVAGLHYTEREKVEQIIDAMRMADAIKLDRPQIRAPQHAFNLIWPMAIGLENEVLWVITLNTRNRVLKVTDLYKGTVNMSNLRYAELFRDAVRLNGEAIIIAHNHPSGDPSPSPEDVNVFRRAKEAGKILDIDVLDSIIIGGNRYVSLAERGLGG